MSRDEEFRDGAGGTFRRPRWAEQPRHGTWGGDTPTPGAEEEQGGGQEDEA